MESLNFSDLNLSDEIMRAITGMGYEAPTSIQHQCIPPIMAGKDLVGQAQTGTGKTAAFGIPALQLLDHSNKKIQTLVLCPTRELAIQVTGEILKLGQYYKGLNVVPVYGGQPIDRQFRALKQGAHIVVGTPGRVIDHLNRRTLDLSALSMIVLDEADEMLNMGFREDIETILSFTTTRMQRVMFSATVSPPIRTIMQTYMKEPVMVSISKRELAAPNIRQVLVEVRDSMRVEAIARLMDVNNYKLGLVFCNTKRMSDDLVQQLHARGYAADVLNGDMRQQMRDKVMAKLRKGDLDLLVATDVAARGLDVDDVDVVFNFDIPQDPENYVHRIGRTGRAGRSGTSITFANSSRNRKLQFIERLLKQRMEVISMPSLKQVEASRMENFMTEVTDALEKGGLRPYIEQIEAFAERGFSTSEVAAALLKLRIDASGKGFSADKEEKSFPEFKGTSSNEPMVRLVINIGDKLGVRKGDIVGAIAGETNIPGRAIGQIVMQKKHTFVDIPASMADHVIQKMNLNQIKGNRVLVEKAK